LWLAYELGSPCKVVSYIISEQSFSIWVKVLVVQFNRGQSVVSATDFRYLLVISETMNCNCADNDGTVAN